jgi:hypothetical protein
MNDFTIAIYCFVDDYLQLAGKKTDSRRKLTDAELITTALVGARYFAGNMVVACNYMQVHQRSKMPDKSNFNRQLHRLQATIAALFFALGACLKELNTRSEYIIDSFPVAVCRNIRIPRCRLLTDEAYRGYNASKREYFYGFKVQIITTVQGLPVDYFIVAGSVHDGAALKAMNIDLPAGSCIYGDSAYLNYELEDLYAQCDCINLMIARKSNNKRKDHPALEFIKNTMRKRIETSFSEIEAAFPRAIHAVTPEGFLLKLLLFIFAFTLAKSI